MVGIYHLFAFNSFDLVYHVPIVDFWEANKICHPIVQFFQDPELVIYEYPYIGSSFDFYCNFDLASLVKCWENYAESTFANLADDVEIGQLLDDVMHIILIFHFNFIYICILISKSGIY